MTAEPTEDDVRAEVRAWAARELGPGAPTREWRAALADSGWGCPTWPGSPPMPGGTAPSGW